jgi:hypothetical protein
MTSGVGVRVGRGNVRESSAWALNAGFGVQHARRVWVSGGIGCFWLHLSRHLAASNGL